MTDPGAAPIFGGRAIVECRSCRLLQISDPPERQTLSQFYRDTYRSSGRYSRGIDQDSFPFDSGFFLSRARSIRNFIAETGWQPNTPAPRVLDFGAGYGHVLHGIREGWPGADLLAVEPDPSCVPFLNRLGARNLSTDESWLPTEVEPQSLDLIVSAQVLEHLLEPVHALRQLSRLLKPEGVMVLEVPNCDGQGENELDTTPHIAFFDSQSLSRCVDFAGGELLRLDTCGQQMSRPTWRDAIPTSLRPPLRFIRDLARGVRGRTPPPVPVDELSWRDPATIPDAEFAHYGGDRIWIRAAIKFPGARNST